MRITKLKWKSAGWSKWDIESGPYRIDGMAFNLYYNDKLICEAYEDDEGDYWERKKYLAQAALDHANKLLEEKCS